MTDDDIPRAYKVPDPAVERELLHAVADRAGSLLAALDTFDPAAVTVTRERLRDAIDVLDGYVQREDGLAPVIPLRPR